MPTWGRLIELWVAALARIAKGVPVCSVYHRLIGGGKENLSVHVYLFYILEAMSVGIRRGTNDFDRPVGVGLSAILKVCVQILNVWVICELGCELMNRACIQFPILCHIDKIGR